MILSVFGRDVRRAARSRVWLDGVEVTQDCQIAIVDEPDEAGAVLLLKRDASGHPYLDPLKRDIAREWHRGLVVIREGSVP